MGKNSKNGKSNGIQAINIGASKRYEKWNMPSKDDKNKEWAKFANSDGIVGTIYVPKDADVPDELTIKFVKD